MLPMTIAPASRAGLPARFALLLLLLLAGFALRLEQLPRESLWRDEVDSIRFAQAPWETVLGNFGRPGENGPLYHLMLRGWLAGAGVSDLALRAFSVLAGVLLLAVLYRLARRLLGPRPALVALLLLVVSPVLIWYAGEGKMYSLQPLLIASALLALSARRWLAFAGLMAAATFVHVLSPLALPVAFVWGLVLRRSGARVPVRAAVLAGLAILPVAVPLLGVWWRGANLGHPPVGLAAMFSRSLALWAFGPAQPELVGLPWAGLLVVGAGLLGLAAFGATAAGPRTAAVLVAWLLAPLAGLAVVSARVPLYEPRYLAWCAPALSLLVAAGLNALRPRALRGAALIAVLGLAALGVLAQRMEPIRPDNRAAAAWLGARAAPADAAVFVIPYGRHPFEHYLTQPLPFGVVEGAYVNGGDEAAAERAVSAVLAPALAPGRRVWLVETEPWMWDAGGAHARWLAAHGRIVERLEVHGVTVTGYDIER